MKRIIIGSIIASVIALCYLVLHGQTAQRVSLEEKIGRHAVALENDSSFGALDEVLKDKRIVILGEASHFEGRTFEIKYKLVRHLIDSLGFDILGLECGGFLECLVLPHKDQVCHDLFSTDFHIKYAWPATIWAEAVECQPLIESMMRGDIPFYGFEANGSAIPIYCLSSLLSDIDKEFASVCDWKKLSGIFSKAVAQYVFPDRAVSGEDDLYFRESISKIKNRCDKLLAEGKIDKDLLDIAVQGIKNIRAAYNGGKIHRHGDLPFEQDYEAIIVANNIRDQLIADNIIWYLERNPDKKMVIWCANFHGARDISQSEYPAYPDMYMRTRLMGEHLAETYGDQLYSLAFTYPSGNKDEIEKYLAVQGMDYGFIDFSALRYKNDYFDKEFKSNCIGYKSGKWQHIFDGIYFIRQPKMSTKLNPTQ